MKVYPSILTDSISVAEQQLEICKESGVVQVVQIDVIDGYFTDNLTITPTSLEEYEFSDLQLDFHLMTQEPIDFVREISEISDHLPVRAIIGQVEQMSSQADFIDEVKREWKVGLSLNLYTPLEAIDDQSWERIDIIQLMSIEAGEQGRDFSETIYEKLEELQDFIARNEYQIEVIIDGGVSFESIDELASYDVDAVSVGSALWKADNFIDSYSQLENAV